MKNLGYSIVGGLLAVSFFLLGSLREIHTGDGFMCYQTSVIVYCPTIGLEKSLQFDALSFRFLSQFAGSFLVDRHGLYSLEGDQLITSHHDNNTFLFPTASHLYDLLSQTMYRVSYASGGATLLPLYTGQTSYINQFFVTGSNNLSASNDRLYGGFFAYDFINKKLLRRPGNEIDIDIQDTIYSIGSARSSYFLIDNNIYHNVTPLTGYIAGSELTLYNNKFLWHGSQLRFYDKFVGVFDDTTCSDLPKSYATQSVCATNSSIIVKTKTYPRNNMTEDEIVEFVKTLPAN